MEHQKQYSALKGYLQIIPFLALAAGIAGMFMSRAMVSISMMVMIGYAVVLVDPRKTFRTFFNDRVLVALSLLFFLYAFSCFNSTEDPAFFLERVRLKLPFLALPIAFAALKNTITERRFSFLLYFFFYMVVFTTLIITFHFAADFEEINNAYKQGRVIDTPFSHIRYSLMVAFAIFTGYFIIVKKMEIRYSWERWLIAIFSAYLIFFIHLLAVRSGLVAFYACVVYLIFNFIFRGRQLKSALFLAATVVLLPVLAYLILPSVKAKVNYMKYDLQQLFQFNNASGLSDGGRILSIEKGMELFRDHPVAGVGIGDLKQEMTRRLEEAPEHPRENLLPHNQFVFVAAGTGTIGLLVFCLGVLLPLFNRRNLQNILFICFHIIVLSSFLTEATVEEQMGTAFYLQFLLLIYVFLQSEKS
ncbi:MAG: O-antigen ligase family protein [Chitinophagales bacterium]